MLTEELDLTLDLEEISTYVNVRTEQLTALNVAYINGIS